VARVALDSNIALIVAALDLKLVRLIRGAIAENRGARGPLGNVIEPGPRFEPRPVVHPTPRFEPRPVVHPTPRFLPRAVIEPRPVEMPAAVLAPAEPEKPRVAKLVLTPPWKVLPWENPVKAEIPVKVIKHRPDIVRKGKLIDCYM
jgi:hypothetical protein